MASIVLSTVGSAIGSSIGIPGGGLLGSQLGKVAGGFVDGAIFGSKRKLQDRNGPRLAELGVQASTYGKMIPIVYGNMRLAGNIIWSRPIKETVTTTTSSTSTGGKGGGGGGVTQTSNTYTYSITLAVAICEGEIDEVVRIWADAKQLDFSLMNVRIYKGSETQTADTLIQSFEGSTNTPAYRGLAYVVFEDFQLGDYGNRIPNFTFEVKKKLQHADYDGEITENLLTAITLIPGAGEFVYDTTVQTKIPGDGVGSTFVQADGQYPLNMHNVTGDANVKLSLDQLAATFPNLEWVSIVIAWFGDDMDAGACVVKPGVEYQTGGQTSPNIWSVGSYTRDTARLIMQISDAPQFGGTPSDSSVTNLITELKSRGYHVMLYPMLFMDVAGKNWRGELTGSLSDVSTFFTKTNGYNDFINHYATLADSAGADAIVIGSELIGLTSVGDGSGNFPAVTQLVSLAASVKSTVGSSVTVTYAADWSEYHHEANGWYNLDPLWASSNIDVIGIDAYFPIKDSATNTYDIETLMAGWTSGEGYDYYYTDAARTITASLSEAYAWKNLAWFWENTHTNPDLSTSAWVPESKPIWFTEFGFPSVDNAANQPNVFYDPSTAGSAFPYQSKGRVDFNAQRAAITATLHAWAGSGMVEKLFLWAWDARPYPYWPDLTNVWSDGAVWKTGHWVQGKFGSSALAAIVTDIATRADMEDDVDVSRLVAQTEGYVILTPQSLRASLRQLESAYLFDTVESDYTLKFLPRGQLPATEIASSELAVENRNQSELLNVVRAQEIELPKRVNVVYLDRLLDYQPSTQYSQRAFTQSQQIQNTDIPVVLSDQYARNLADIILYTNWVERHAYDFLLPASYMYLEPGDVVDISHNSISHTLRITNTQLLGKNIMLISGVAEDITAYDFYSTPSDNNSGITSNVSIPLTQLELLDIPALPSDNVDQAKIRYAANGASNSWKGAVLFRSDDGGTSYTQILDIPRGTKLGYSTTALAAGPENVFDEVNTITVQLHHEDDTLSSVTELAMLNGANAALIGNEIIQFQNAALVGDNKYTLSRLLRGRQGTEHAMSSHDIGDRFVLLDSGVTYQNISPSLLYLTRPYKAVSIGKTLSSATAQNFTYQGVYLKPLSPVHASAELDGVGDIQLSWVRRTRGLGEWQDNVDVPLNETIEAYEIDVLNGSDVVRTISSATNAASYTLAQQTTDLGDAAGSLTFEIYQLSTAVGRGYKAEVVYAV